jgi:tetratricopeptide (TPR) repeat protein
MPMVYPRWEVRDTSNVVADCVVGRCRAAMTLVLVCALCFSTPTSADCLGEGLRIAPQVISPSSPNVTPPAEPQDPVTRALSRAQVELNQCNYLGAESLLRAALESLTVKRDDREQLQAALQRVELPLWQMLELDEIERLSLHGRGSDVSGNLRAMISTAADRNIRHRVAYLLDDGWGFADQYLAWIRNGVLYITGALGGWLFVLMLRRVFSIVLGYRRKHYRLTDLTDVSGRNFKNYIATYFEYWRDLTRSNPTSGLYVMEASSVPVAPSFRFGTEENDIGRELDSVEFKIGGTSVNVLVRSAKAFARWWFPQPTEIQGLAYEDGDQRLCARLSVRLPESGFALFSGRQRPHSNILTVSATAAGTGEEAVQAAAKEVSFKMLYAIAKGGTAPAQLANDLRVGLDELRAYLAAGDAPLSKLEGSRAAFERVRKADPEFLEAHLYEGIALDLLERHEEAAAHFAHVKGLTQNAAVTEQKVLHEQAQYNEAVAHLRNLYGLAPIDRAIALLDDLLGTSPALRDKPLLALTAATLADAWANRTVQWKKIAQQQSKNPDAAALRDILRAHENEVLPRVQEVQTTLAFVEGEIQKGDPTAADQVAKGWNPDTRRQVQWGLHNAKADFYLYAAVQLERLKEPHRTELDIAIDELQRCEMLLPAGVETLSNAGTAFLIRGEEGDLRKARRHLRRAIELNANYEYAYYRLAQAWEKEPSREKVIETLKAFPGYPGIPSFHAMFTQYSVNTRVL